MPSTLNRNPFQQSPTSAAINGGGGGNNNKEPWNRWAEQSERNRFREDGLVRKCARHQYAVERDARFIKRKKKICSNTALIIFMVLLIALVIIGGLVAFALMYHYELGLFGHPPEETQEPPAIDASAATDATASPGPASEQFTTMLTTGAPTSPPPSTSPGTIISSFTIATSNAAATPTVASTPIPATTEPSPPAAAIRRRDSSIT